MPEKPVPPIVVSALTVLITGAALVGFVSMFGIGLAKTVGAASTPSFSDAYTYVATALVGLVGAVVAAGFGQTPQKPAVAPAAGAGGGMVGPEASLLGLGSFVLARKVALNWHAILGAAYAIVYVGFAIAAIVIWVKDSAVTPDLIKNLASVGLGMMIPIVAAFFSVQAPA
jgi:hypothetical protein